MDTRFFQKKYSELGFRMLACAVIINAVQIIVPILLNYAGIDWQSDMNVSLAVSMIPMFVLGYPVSYLIMRDESGANAIGKRKMKAGHFLIAFLMSYAFLMAGNIIGLIITYGIGLIKGEPVTNSIQEIVTGTNIWTTSVFTVLLAPIFEELLFRKFLCDRVAGFGYKRAILLSGLMFGLFHGNLNQFFYAFFIGCFFAFIYVNTGRIIYTIGLHMMVNFIGSVVGGLYLQNFDPEHLTPGMIIYSVLYVFSVYGICIAGLVMILVNLSRLKIREGVDPYVERERTRAALVNAGMILYYVFFAFMIILQTVL